MTLTSRDLVARGFTYNELARDARRGALVRVRRGAYLRPVDVAVDATERHRQLVEGTLPLLLDGSAVSHASAAVLHGLPVWGVPLRLVHATRASGRGKRRGHLHLHITPIMREETVLVDGIRVTSLARTVVDLGRTAELQQAVAAGDAALRAGLDPGDLHRALAAAEGRRGVAAARRAIALLDPRSESAGESASRVVLHEAGLTPSDLQLEVFDEDGRLVGRSDFGWRERRTLGEFDGRVKYGRLLKPGQTSEQVVYAEKCREDALRDQGWQVVRWSWSDLQQPHLLVERLQRAFRRTGS